MALITGNRPVRSLQAKRTVLVIRQRVARGSEAHHGVTGFAGAEIFALGELPEMSVAVTGDAPLESGDSAVGCG